MTTTFLALVHKEPGSCYGISFPDVPGCVSAGDTLEEAMNAGAEALEAHLDFMRQTGDRVPSPRTFEELRTDQEFIEDSADAIVTSIALPQRLAAE